MIASRRSLQLIAATDGELPDEMRRNECVALRGEIAFGCAAYEATIARRVEPTYDRPIWNDLDDRLMSARIGSRAASTSASSTATIVLMTAMLMLPVLVTLRPRMLVLILALILILIGGELTAAIGDRSVARLATSTACAASTTTGASTVLGADHAAGSRTSSTSAATTAVRRDVIAIGALIAIARMSARTWAAAAPRGASTFAHATLRVMGYVCAGSRASLAGCDAPLGNIALSLSSGRDERGEKRNTGCSDSAR